MRTIRDKCGEGYMGEHTKVIVKASRKEKLIVFEDSYVCALYNVL